MPVQLVQTRGEVSVRNIRRSELESGCAWNHEEGIALTDGAFAELLVCVLNVVAEESQAFPLAERGLWRCPSLASGPEGVSQLDRPVRRNDYVLKVIDTSEQCTEPAIELILDPFVEPISRGLVSISALSVSRTKLMQWPRPGKPPGPRSEPVIE